MGLISRYAVPVYLCCVKENVYVATVMGGLDYKCNKIQWLEVSQEADEIRILCLVVCIVTIDKIHQSIFDLPEVKGIVWAQNMHLFF